MSRKPELPLPSDDTIDEVIGGNDEITASSGGGIALFGEFDVTLS
jgi:hypothetical protein